MSEEKNNQEEEFNLDLNEDAIEEMSTFDASKQKITELGDGTEVISDLQEESEEEKEEISDEALLRIIEFATGRKDVSPEELQTIREDEKELERLIKIVGIKSRKLIYNPKKKFGIKYKKERQRKNRQAKRQRIINRKK